MSKKILWLVVNGLMVLSLVLAACGAPATTPTAPVTPATPTTPAVPTSPAAPTTPVTPAKEPAKPASDTPRYGGILRLPLNGDLTEWDTVRRPDPPHLALTHQGLWSGDWTKGNAGGHGTHETDWERNTNDVFALKQGVIAESTKWTADVAKNEGTIVYKIRQGIRYALNPVSEASRLVNGRELTADDVVVHLTRTVTDPFAYFPGAVPELKSAKITKTGPWEVTVNLPVDALLSGVSRFGDSTFIQAAELVQKYGNLQNWKLSVGTGAFILTDYVPGSQAVYVKNPNFWMKDPIGPGEGNQLPYLNGIQFIILPDASTRQAALRTAKIDQLSNMSLEDAAVMRKTAPQLKELQWAGQRLGAVGANVNRPPFNDVRVRRALMMSLDFDSINQGLYDGKGQIVTWPVSYFKEYAGLYVGWDDKDFPESARELYKYNPDKAKQLLKEAGYPNGFKTSILLTSTEVDYFSIWKDMWAKVGIDLKLDVKESGAINAIREAGQQEGFAIGGAADAQLWFNSSFIQGTSRSNISFLNDPVINKSLEEVRLMAVTKGEAEAMKIYRDMVKYILDQAYAMPRHKVPMSHFWWPWIRNYSGETHIGYSDGSWPQWVWLDKDMKKSMGY